MLFTAEFEIIIVIVSLNNRIDIRIYNIKFGIIHSLGTFLVLFYLIMLKSSVIVYIYAFSSMQLNSHNSQAVFIFPGDIIHLYFCYFIPFILISAKIDCYFGVFIIACKTSSETINSTRSIFSNQLSIR